MHNSICSDSFTSSWTESFFSQACVTISLKRAAKPHAPMQNCGYSRYPYSSLCRGLLRRLPRISGIRLWWCKNSSIAAIWGSLIDLPPSYCGEGDLKETPPETQSALISRTSVRLSRSFKQASSTSPMSPGVSRDLSLAHGPPESAVATPPMITVKMFYTTNDAIIIINGKKEFQISNIKDFLKSREKCDILT